MVEMLRPEQAERFVDQFLMLGDLLGLGVQLIRIVGDDVERHGIAQIDRLEMRAREDRRILQCFVINRLIRNAVAGLLAAQRGRRLPSGGVGDGRLDRDLPGEITGGIERYRFPLDVQHLGRHHDAALIAGRGRQELELRDDRLRALGHVDMESEDIERIAPPADRLAIGGEGQARQLLDLPARRMIAGQPFGHQQRQRAGRCDRDRLLDAENTLGRVGRIDLQPDRAAGPGRVAGCGDGIDDGQGRGLRSDGVLCV